MPETWVFREQDCYYSLSPSSSAMSDTLFTMNPAYTSIVEGICCEYIELLALWPLQSFHSVYKALCDSSISFEAPVNLLYSFELSMDCGPSQAYTQKQHICLLVEKE